MSKSAAKEYSRIWYHRYSCKLTGNKCIFYGFVLKVLPYFLRRNLARTKFCQVCLFHVNRLRPLLDIALVKNEHVRGKKCAQCIQSLFRFRPILKILAKGNLRRERKFFFPIFCEEIFLARFPVKYVYFM